MPKADKSVVAPAVPSAADPVSLSESLRLGLRLRRHVIPLLPAALAVMGVAIVQADLVLGGATLAKNLLDSFGGTAAAGATVAGGPQFLSSPLIHVFQKDGSVVFLVIGVVAVVLLAETVGLLIEQARFRIAQRFRSGLQAELLDAFMRDTGASRLKRDLATQEVTFRQDASGLGMFLIFGLLGCGEKLVKLVLYSAGLWRLGGGGGWVLVAALVPGAFVVKIGIMRLFLRWEQRVGAHANAMMMSAQRAMLGFFPVMARLVLLRGERTPASQLLRKMNDAAVASQRFQIVSGFHGSTAHLLSSLALPLAALLMAGLRVTPGAIFQAAAVFQAILDCVGGLLTFPSQFIQYGPALRRVSEALEVSPPGPRPADLTSLLGGLAPEVRTEKVVFGYEPGAAVISGLDLTIPSGRAVCLVGGSGSGKTTLARLLIGELQPVSGRISMGDTEVTRWPLWWRREIVGFLPEKVGFLPVSLRENIRFGRSDITDDEVARAVSACGLRAVLETYGDSPLIVPDEQLSAGEQRRVGIARLLVGGQPVWMIDEPLANLDKKLMRDLARAILTAAHGRTTLIITHDPEHFAPTPVIFLDRGRVAAEGSHAELLHTCPAYAEVYQQPVRPLSTFTTPEGLPA